MKKIFTLLLAVCLTWFLSIQVNAQIGSTCASAHVVSSLPFIQTGLSTSGTGDNYDTSPCSAYISGNDYVFSYSPSTDIYVSITLTNTSTYPGVGISVLNDCPDQSGVVCLAGAQALSNPSIASVFLPGGSTYYIVISSNNIFSTIGQTTNFDIEIDELVATDGGVSAIVSPITGCGLGSETVTVTISNFGVLAISGFDVAFTVDGGAPVVETVTNTVAAGATYDYTFIATADLSSPSTTYNINAYTQITGDGNSSNNASSVSVSNTPVIAAFPYTSDFDIPVDWWTAGGTSSSWEKGTPAKTNINHANSMPNCWVTGLTANHNAGEQSWVMSPCIDMSSLALPVVEMWICYEQGLMSYANIDYSIDGGTTWTTIGANGDPNWYNNANGFSGSSAGAWYKVSHTVPALAGQSNVLLRVFFNGSLIQVNEGFAFDNVVIRDTPANDVGTVAIDWPVTGCNLSSNEVVTIRIANFGLNTQSNILVMYSTNGGSSPVLDYVPGPLAPGDTVSFSFTSQPADLSAVTSYDFVAETQLTGDLNISNDQMGFMLVHSPSIASFPFNEDFESGPGSWYSYGTSSSWAHGTPAGTIINSAASGSKAWVTNLTGNYNAGENSYVESPCFDLSALTNPNVKLNIWYELTQLISGASLEYTIDDGASWDTLVPGTSAINWFNSGNEWTGSSAAWLNASNTVPYLAGVPSVRFRVAFGGSPFGPTEGLAFDDFHIGECNLPAPTAGFTYVVNGQTVTFTNTSTGATSYSWNFGDLLGGTSTDPDPIYTYTLPGTYDVTLIAMNDCNSDTIIFTFDITVGMAEKDPVSISLYPNPSSGNVTLSLENINNGAAIYIYDMKGVQVYSQTGIQKSTNEIMFHGLPSGLYYISVISAGKLYSEKLIIE